MNLGKNIFNLRKKSGISQEELGERIGVTRQTISNWELNETTPNVEQLKLLSKEFNISIDELVGNDIKDVVVNKVSNTEHLAGVILKLIKVLGIILVIFLILFAFFFVYGIYPNRISDDELSKSFIKCKIDNKDYSYEIEYNPENGEVKYAGGDDFLVYSANTEKYNYKDEVIDSIKSYAKSKNGVCKISDN